MSAEDDIRAAVAAYKAGLSVDKPKISLTVFGDGEIQLFLSSEQASVTHASGTAKTLDGAATALKEHLVKRLTEEKSRDEADLAKHVERKKAAHERMAAAITSLSTVTPEEILVEIEN